MTDSSTAPSALTPPTRGRRRLLVFASGIKRPSPALPEDFFTSGAYERYVREVENFLIDFWLYSRRS